MSTLFLQIHFILILFLVAFDQPEKERAAARENFPLAIALNTAPATAYSDVELMDDGDDPVVTTDDDICIHYDQPGTINGLKEALFERAQGDAKGRSPPLCNILTSLSSDRLTLPRTLVSLSQAVRPFLPGSNNVVLSEGVRNKRHYSFAVYNASSSLQLNQEASYENFSTLYCDLAVLPSLHIATRGCTG